MFKKDRELLVREQDVTKLIKLLNKENIYEFRCGCCGWKLRPDAWFIMFKSRDRSYCNILQNMVKYNIELLPETCGY